MSIRLRVPDNYGKSLCQSCEYAHRTVDDRGTETIHCTNLSNDPKVLRPVVECGSYAEKGKMNKWHMEKIAWIIEVKDNTVIGFAPPKAEND